ncbi:B3 domain-containing protein Os11g0197600 [Vigna radiata var. radiata]|uniref:B3 domain-containing protein Os11g0197600 n=1 Tax=Vigna radiata var. radiata TaxID=3916 RepID=A0A1S3U9I4_VIGRR|nr:B3 domain-containing protein Os11g0197600 [Vigna radiata var. radiata]XP_022638284.1 B3 domain-containing protein Os11g0197600 [Vigna radiata var. radiata]
MGCDCGGKLSLRKPHFYEVYSSAFSSHRLKIPDGFVCRMEGRTYGSFSLTGPSGNVWKVQLLKQDNDLFFHHGWSSFVMDHRLECGDLLVFRYDGHLHFTVQVFDKDACEKEAAFMSECSQSSSDFEEIVGQKRDVKESCSLDIAFDGVAKKRRGCKYENREIEPGFVGKELLRYEVVRPIRMFRETEETSKACLANDSLVPFHMDNRNEEAAILYRSGKEDGHYFLGGVSLSNVSAQDEKKVAQSFTSKFPYFVRIMKSFNVSGSYTLNIPYQFSMAHLPNCKIKIILHNLKGEHWTVNSVPTTRVHTSHTLCGGWMAFVRGNNIKIGDICIFELVNECELRVHIAGIGKDGLEDDQVGRVNAGHAGTTRYMPMNAKVNSKSIRKVDLSDKKWPKIGQETVLSIDLKKSGRASNTSKKMGLCPQSKAAHKKLATPRRHRVEDELSSQAKSGLRMLFALDEQRVAQAFSSPFPSFVKIMKMFNVSGSYTLKIPYQFSAAHLPTYKTEVILRNSRGECWTVNSVPDAKGRTVHTFCGGWMAFVRDNDINFGDTCIFELVTQCEMQVYISGVGKEGPDHQNAHLKLDRLSILPSTC